MNVAYGKPTAEGLAHRPSTLRATASPWRSAPPLVVPVVLLLAGGLVGLPSTLNAVVAWQRLLGLVVAGVSATLALVLLPRARHAAPVLSGGALAAAAGGLWVVAASGPDAFHGLFADPLKALFGRLFWTVQLTQPVAETNTWFIVGYNGLADLCLVVLFACLGILLGRPSRAASAVAGVPLAASVLLLSGTGARGALAGLAVGLCVVGMAAWRRGWLVALVSVPVAIALAALGPKSLDVSSTLGRWSFWGDLVRLLTEFPLTGVGLGVDTAYRVGLLYEVNPDPERLAYAHNTFVQAYLEQGPLGALGMLAIPVVAALAAVSACRHPATVASARAFLLGGLGLVAALEVHGLTDQVVTTNVGTGLLLVGLATVLASLGDRARRSLGQGLRRLGLGALVAVVAVLAIVALLPAGRARLLVNVAGLRMVQGWADGGSPEQRAASLAAAEGLLSVALTQDPGDPAAQRDLARTRAQRYDDAGALASLRAASASPRLDAFDMLQVAHLYRDLAFANDGYSWAMRAYAAWGRTPTDTDPILLAYSRATLQDNPSAQRLAEQGEAALRARDFEAARRLFGQALSFGTGPPNPYLQERLGAAERGVEKYGG